jgi:hypothetical protein
MIYDDGTGTPIHVPLADRRPLSEEVPESTDAIREAIRRIAKNRPRRGPRQIHAELRLTRHDVPLAVVEAVLAEMQRALDSPTKDGL